MMLGTCFRVFGVGGILANLANHINILPNARRPCTLLSLGDGAVRSSYTLMIIGGGFLRAF